MVAEFVVVVLVVVVVTIVVDGKFGFSVVRDAVGQLSWSLSLS